MHICYKLIEESSTALIVDQALKWSSITEQLFLSTSTTLLVSQINETRWSQIGD